MRVKYVCNMTKAQTYIMLLHRDILIEVCALVRLICMQAIVEVKLYLIFLVMFVSLTEISG